MKLSRRQILSLTLTVAAGCGGGGTSGPTGIVFTLDWPQTRTLPLAAKSLRLRVLKDGTPIAERFYLPGPVVEEQLTGLPDFVPLVVDIAAFGTASATGAALASATIPLRLARGRIDRITLTLTSAIAQVLLTADASTAPWSLSASGRSSSNEVVLTEPEQWEWTLNNSSLGTLSATGASAAFTPLGFGEVTVTVKEKESGKSAQFTKSITLGEPTTTEPAVALRTLSAPLISLFATEAHFVTLTAGTLSGIQTTGATAWETHPNATLNRFSAVMADRVLLWDGGSNFACYLTDSGSKFWQRDFGVKPTTPLVYDNTGMFLYNTAEPLLNARGLFDGSALWTTALTGTPLYGDSVRFVSYDATSKIAFAQGRVTGAALWQLLFTSPPTYLGATTGSIPLLFFAVAGELRAIQAQSGARLWSTSLDSQDLLVAASQSVIFVRTATSVVALNTITGSTLWSRADVARVLGMDASGDLVVQPASNDRIQAIRATDGSLLWNQYLPTGTNTVRFSGNCVTVQSTSRGQLYGINASTGAYVWRLPLTEPSPQIIAIGNTVAVAEPTRLRLLS